MARSPGFSTHTGRWSAPAWPEEYGGRGADLFGWLAFEEEYWAAGAPGRVSQNGISLLAPTLLAHGTAEQRARVLPPMASGEVIWAQAWSEPEAGSDLAALRSRAVRTDGGWLLSGQKTWSSRAAFADRAFGIFRTDPGAARPHQGLTCLMFGLRAPGVTVRPIGRLDGKPAFAEIFLDEVFVPDEDVIGGPGRGWRVAMAATGDERGLTLRSPGRFLAAAARLTDLWREAGDPTDTALRDRVADAVFTVSGDELRLAPGPGERSVSADPARRLFRPEAGGEAVAAGPGVSGAARAAGEWAGFATAALSLGCGEALLRATVAYVGQRTQFGVPVGSFQAVKHRLADTLLGLEFARPLLYGAAVGLAAGSPGAGAAVAAAKVAAGEAGYAGPHRPPVARRGLGCTEELDLAWWLRRARPLRDAWGTPSACRARVLADRPGPAA
ncbi:acyl-CoA dehydrogenase family protein [Streptomyces sp. NPDC096095]